MLYTADSTARWTVVAGAETPDEGERRFMPRFAVLVANLALMLLPPAVGVLVLMGLLR